MSNERFARLVEIQLECSHKTIVKEVEDHFVPRNEFFRVSLIMKRHDLGNKTVKSVTNKRVTKIFCLRYMTY